MELVNPFNEQYFALFGNTEHDKNEIGWKTKDPVLKNNEPNVDCSKSDISLLQSHTAHDASDYSKKIEEGIPYQSFLSDSVKMQKKTVNPYLNQAPKFNINQQFKRSLGVHENDYYVDKCRFSQSSSASVIKKKHQQSGVNNNPSFQQKSFLGLGFSDHRNQYEPFYLRDMSINQQYHYKAEVCQGVYTKPVFSSINTQSCEPLQTQMHKSYSSGAFKNIEPTFYGFVPQPSNDLNSYNSYMPYIGSLSNKYKASPLTTLDNSSYIDDFNRSTTVEHLPSIAKLNAKRSHQEYQADLNMMRYNFYEQNQTNIEKSSSINKPIHLYPNENKPIHHYPNEVSAGLFSSNVQIPQQPQRSLNSSRSYDQQTCFYYNTPAAHIPSPTYGTPCYSNSSILPADLENQFVYDSLLQELWQGSKSNLLKNQPTQNTIFSNQNALEENYCLIPSSSLFKENLHPLNNTCTSYQSSSVKSYTSNITASDLRGQPSVPSSYLQHSHELENMPHYYTHQTISGASTPLTVINVDAALSVSSLESSKFNKKIPGESLSEYEQATNQQPTESMHFQPKLYSLRGKGLQSVQSSPVKKKKKIYAKKIKAKNACMLSAFQHNFPPSYLSIGKVKGILGLRSSSCNNSSAKDGYKCTQCVGHDDNDDNRSCIHIEREKFNKVNPSSKHNMGLRKRAFEEESLKNLTVDTSLDSQKCDLKSAYKKSYANQDKRNLLLQTSQTDNNINKKVTSLDSCLDTDGFLSPISMKSFEDCEQNKNSSQFSINYFQNTNDKDSLFSHSIDMQNHAKLMSNACKQKFSFAKKKRTSKQDSYEKVCLYLSTLKKEQNKECSPNNVAGIITAQLELCIKLNLPIEINQIVRRRNLLKRSKVQSFKRIFIEIFLNSYKKIHNTTHGRKQLEPKKRLVNKI